MAQHNMQVTSVTISTSKQIPTEWTVSPTGPSQYSELLGKLNNRFIIGGNLTAKHLHQDSW